MHSDSHNHANTEVLLYPNDTAGHCMTAKVPTVHESDTLLKVHDMLATENKNLQSINYVYILDDQRKLVGVLSIHEIFAAARSARAGDICRKSSLFFVHPETHQERVAYLALKHRIKAIPVVDHEGFFIGEITSDSILRILHKEMHEDSLKRAGIRHPDALHSNVLTLSLFSSFKHRIPWLFLGLIGGLLMAKVIGFFEQTLEQNLVLAAFLPLIVYMSSAVGTQMETYIIRDLATEQKLQIQPYLLRNILIVFCIGITLSLLLFVSYGFFSGAWYLALVLGSSLLASVLSSLFTGLLIPLLFSKFSLDPADASGPVATILQDMMSIVIYFGIATWML